LWGGLCGVVGGFVCGGGGGGSWGEKAEYTEHIYLFLFYLDGTKSHAITVISVHKTQKN